MKRLTMLALALLWVAAPLRTRADYFANDFTDGGILIQVMVVTEDWSAEYRAALDASVAGAYPGLTYLGYSTKYRNAHTYTWLPGRWVWLNAYDTGNNYQLEDCWLDGTHAHRFTVTASTFTSGEISTMSGWWGTRLVYSASDFSALWAGGQNISSKWGHGPTIITSLWYNPYWPCAVDVYEQLN